MQSLVTGPRPAVMQRKNESKLLSRGGSEAHAHTPTHTHTPTHPHPRTRTPHTHTHTLTLTNSHTHTQTYARSHIVGTVPLMAAPQQTSGRIAAAFSEVKSASLREPHSGQANKSKDLSQCITRDLHAVQPLESGSDPLSHFLHRCFFGQSARIDIIRSLHLQTVELHPKLPRLHLPEGDAARCRALVVLGRVACFFGCDEASCSLSKSSRCTLVHWQLRGVVL
mmetsp:Transcript_47984/g.102756  ORF Transcript_47984/g.102756 Transcript_47984/m.102756 type:complete len:224 (-) Transcript_47984:239-910(-)